jgi:DNA-binding transcriptional MerR regulator
MPAQPAADPAALEPTTDHHAPPDRFLRIQEAADEIGLTTRAIRYYEEQGLLRPAGRSEGSYRLFDADDVERLRFIKGLRDDAGFSLAEIRQLLEDEQARRAVRTRIRSTDDPVERRRLLEESLARAERQVEILRHKAARIAAMIDEATSRSHHLREHLEELDGGPDPHRPRPATPAGRAKPERRR